MGRNYLVHGYNGGPGYNGGGGQTCSIAQLLSTARRQFPESKLVVNSVICRRDISKRALTHFNDQLYSMCNHFGAYFADASLAIGDAHLASDGKNLNRQGNIALGDFTFHYINQVNENQQPPTSAGGMSHSKLDSTSSSPISSRLSENWYCDVS